MIVCRRCGQRNDPATEFCTSCSAYLEWDGHPSTPPTNPPPPVPADRPATAAPAPMPPTPPPAQAAAEAWGPPVDPPVQAAPAPVVPAEAWGPPADPPAPAVPAAGGGGEVRCLECGAGNQGGSRFCRRCGATLDLVVLAGPSTIPPPPPPTNRPAGRPPTSAPAVVERGKGLPPAAVRTAPGPVRPEAEVAPVPTGGTACARCGAGNEPGRRFCRRCGEAFDVPAPPGAAAPARRTSWWRRRRGEAAAPSARAAYRRALDIRFRVLRVLAVVATLGMGAGLLGVSGIDPVNGARDLWRRVFPRDEPVADVTATVDPAAGEQREFGPGAAVDGAPDTAWGTTWGGTPDDDPVPACAPDPGTGGADAALVLTLPEPTELSQLEVQVGLPQGDPDREHQWRPTQLELRYDDGTCESIDLAPDPGPQRHSIDAPRTGTVRLTILAASPPPSGTGTLATLATVRLLHPT